MKATTDKEQNTLTCSFDMTLETDKSLIAKQNLGINRNTCKICGATGDFQSWLGTEMFFGTREKFRYFICPECEVLQIEEFPEDLGRYYQHDYYSYEKPVLSPVKSGAKKDERMILDVGCGAGTWLCNLASIGSVNLFGCDPFIEKDLKYGNGVKIKKCSIHEMTGEYDVISLQNSFEHMPDPHEVFKSFDRLLKHGKGTDGEQPKVEIFIPVFPNTAFDIYGPSWYQMDPPRHFFLYSVKSIGLLAAENDFKVSDVKYFEHPEQFSISRAIQLGVSFTDFYLSQNKPVLGSLKWQASAFNSLSKASLASKSADTAQFTLVRR